ncbi:diphthamide biosynthesis protein 4-like [Salvia miltiorrhiza]|uniref:diphthamide biosynthesis protein 4-like n=1 Tax=Salvia miltiorrhiza TaxID=226208 RepID=UPI0025AB85C8|nr:diphthamide biosynthesis protein 4-like [Salvia miltiorrhiza]
MFLEMECGGVPLYYSLLGVTSDASDHEIRRAYRKLAMQWHPDKWTRTPSLLGEAKHRFQQIQEAYSVLSDRSKRMLYDAGLYSCEDEDEVEGFDDFLGEMVSLMKDVREEENNYSMSEVQSMFWEMAQDFQMAESVQQQNACDSQWGLYDECGDVGNSWWEASMTLNPQLGSFDTFGAHNLCR